MNKYKKPVIDESRLGKNPLLLNLEIVVNRVKVEGQWYKDKDGIMLPADMEVEAVPFTKLFCDKQRRLDMGQLSLRANDLLLWIMMEVEPNKDWLWVNRKRYMEERGVKTYNTYNAAVNELIRFNYIAKVAGPANVFFINPHYFFNGQRAKIFPQHVKHK